MQEWGLAGGFEREQAMREKMGKLARPRRFERPTPAFGGQYSIQLSYGRERLDYSRFWPAAVCMHGCGLVGSGVFSIIASFGNV